MTNTSTGVLKRIRQASDHRNNSFGCIIFQIGLTLVMDNIVTRTYACIKRL